MNGLIGLVILGCLWACGWVIWKIFEGINYVLDTPYRKKREQQTIKDEEEMKVAKEMARKKSEIARKQADEKKAKEEKEFQEKYSKVPLEDILLKGDLGRIEKIHILVKVHGQSIEDANELLKTAYNAAKKAKLSAVKRKVVQKAREIHGVNEESGDRRPIPDEVKMFVWNRDGGKCVNCGSNQALEFDHIIPIVKGGANTERNIQLLCEKCNREKSDNII